MSTVAKRHTTVAKRDSDVGETIQSPKRRPGRPTREESYKDPEDLRKESDSEARKAAKLLGKKVLRSLRDSSTPAREVNDLIRSLATARQSAYPEASDSNLSLNVPAKLLKPIETAILAQQRSVDRGKTSKRPDVHSQDVSKPIESKANSDSESVQFRTSDKAHCVNSVDKAKSLDESST